MVAESTIPAAAPESPPVVAAAAPESKAMETDCSAVDAPASSAEAMEVTAPETEQDLLNKLDLQLTYLFKVHGVDYYEGETAHIPVHGALMLHINCCLCTFESN